MAPGPATDVNGGRGVFSRVLRIPLEPTDPVVEPDPSIPPTVVAKLPIPGPNGDAARGSGAYRREALAYRRLLPSSPVASPTVHAVTEDADGTTLLLEDLTGHRAVDQLDGLGADDALAVVAELAALHAHWRHRPEPDALGVRRSTPSALPPAGLAAGLVALRQRWAGDIDERWLPTFEAMVAGRARLVETFAAAPSPTLCHGDPRADNLVFEATDDGRPVLFDWQQLAVQAGEADVAWMAATSLTVEDRRAVDDRLLAAYGTDVDRYRVGLILPGLAVLLLAQRRATDERTTRFIATSIDRIGAAITDYEVPALAATAR
ncbi:MAG: phosphotransferase [Actinomycetota bacterium]